MKTLFGKNARFAALLFTLTVLFSACTPEATGSLFAETSTPSAEATAEETPSATATPAATINPTPSVTPETTAEPTATPTVVPTATATPTPNPPRFSFAKDFKADWNGASTLPHAIVKTGSKLDKNEYFTKFLGIGYKKSDLPPILFSEAYENGDKYMTILQTAYTYQDRYLMDNQTPMTTHMQSADDIVAYATKMLTGLFPDEMLQNGTVSSFKSRNGNLYTVTVKYPQSFRDAVIDDAAEGILATVGQDGIHELSFQWCDYAADAEMVMEGASFILTELNETLPKGKAVQITSARLVYKPTNMGVRYLPAWQCAGDDGETYFAYLK